jgi:hypothetical protein
MGIEIEPLDENEPEREPTPPPPPKPKRKNDPKRKEQLKKVQLMLEYLDQFDLKECDENCDCHWERDGSLSGSIREVQTKLYHALVRYQIQC